MQEQQTRRFHPSRIKAGGGGNDGGRGEGEVHSGQLLTGPRKAKVCGRDTKKSSLRLVL